MTAILNPSGVAQHRAAREPRARTKDTPTALDMFSGCGGSSQGIEAAGIPVWFAANHWEYAVELHEANHPGAEHFIADLVDETAGDYYHPEMLPKAEIVWASPSCTNHSTANAQKAYIRNLSLFDVHDEEYEDQVTASERSRATATCVLQYARKHRPKLIIVENVVEFANWGVQVGSSRKGDGSTFRWWMSEFGKLGYRSRTLFLNSMFFPPTPQSRDRMYVCFWQEDMRTPDLDHRPHGICSTCDDVVEAKQVFKPRTKVWPLAEWGKYGSQYRYICPSCLSEVKPFAMPALTAIDWSDLGTRVGDRKDDLAPATYARLQRGADLLREWPSFLLPAKNGVGRPGPISTDEPMRTQTTQQEAMLIQAFQVVAAGHTFEREGSNCRLRSVLEQMWSQHTTLAHGIVTAPPSFIDDYQGNPRTTDDQFTTLAGSETHGLVVAPLLYTARGTAEHRNARLTPMSDPLSSVTAGGNHHFMVSPVFAKQNGGPGDTAWHQAALDSMNTATAVDTTVLLNGPEGEMPPIEIDECFYRMLRPDEIKLGMGMPFDFEMWGTARNRVKALGNAVTPPVARWIMERMVAVL